MMKARTVDYNTRTGVVTIEGGPRETKTTLTTNATELDVTASDVSVRADAHLVTVEAVGELPLLVREGKDEGVVNVFTVERPQPTA